MSSYQTLLIEDRDLTRIITLNQPEMFNPLDIISGPELVEALEEADRDQGVRTVVLTGAGPAFSGGGNLRAMREMIESGQPPSKFFAPVAAVLNRSVITLRRLKKPVICALNGVAAGGGLAWALACDFIVASESARFDPGYIRIALNPDGGNSVLVTRLIGHKRATEFFMLGRVIDMEKALAWGMVNQVVAPQMVMENALDLAGRLGRAPAQALAATKALLSQAVLGDLEGMLENERQLILELSDQEDFAEGVKAFFEKREPDFTA